VDLDARYDLTSSLQLASSSQRHQRVRLVNGNPRAGTIDNSEAGQAIFIGSSLYGRSAARYISYRF